MNNNLFNWQNASAGGAYGGQQQQPQTMPYMGYQQQPTMNTGALGASHNNYGGMMQGAMGQLGAGLNQQADRQAYQQSQQVPLQIMQAQQSGMNQRLGMLAPLLARMFGGLGAAAGGGQGGNGFQTMFGQFASGGGQNQAMGPAAYNASMMQGGNAINAPNSLYNRILQSRMGNEVDLNSLFPGSGTRYV